MVSFNTGFTDHRTPWPSLSTLPLPIPSFSLKPGDASQVEQKTQQLMAMTPGMKPRWAVGTQKQHCSAFCIPCPCGEERMNTGLIRPPFPHLFKGLLTTWQGGHATGQELPGEVSS